MLVDAKHAQFVKKHYPIGKLVLSAGLNAAYNVTPGWMVKEHIEVPEEMRYLIRVEKMSGNRLLSRIHSVEQLRSFENMVD